MLGRSKVKYGWKMETKYFLHFATCAQNVRTYLKLSVLWNHIINCVIQLIYYYISNQRRKLLWSRDLMKQTCQVSRISRETHAFCPQKASHARRGVKEHVSHSFQSSDHISASTRPTRNYDLSTPIRIWRGIHFWAVKYDRQSLSVRNWWTLCLNNSWTRILILL